MTPVEERIDHEEARRIAEIRERYLAWANGQGSRYSADWADIHALLKERDALLTEHSALREAAWNAVKVNAVMNPELAQQRLNELDNVMLALPATEPAQPEEEPDG